MMFISGELIALFTFPGIIMHEIAHRFMCDILHVPVYGVQYFAIGSTRAGYVYHHKTTNIWHDFLIGFAPLFVNTFFCMLFTLPYSSSIHVAGEGISTYSNMFLYWIGISMGANAFPSNQDTQNVVESCQKYNKLFFIRILCHFMRFLNQLSRFWMDFVYALLISQILPFLIFGKCINAFT